MKRVLSLVLATLSLLTFATSCHQHEWLDATCDLPMTCKTCNSIAGEPLGHNWLSATCENPKHCSRCTATEGSVLEHVWTDATCSQPQTCITCKMTTGECLDHNFGQWYESKEPSYSENGQESRTCSMCDYTETRVTDKLEPIPRKEPEEVTVLTVNGFVMSEAEYAEHLLSYLPNDYNITQSSFGDYEIIVPDGGTITIYWDGNTPKSYKDNVAFMTDDSETELKSIMPAIVQSLDPELYHNRKNFDKAIEDIRWYIDLGLDNEMMIVGLHTGVAVVYDGYSGMQVMFVTLKYALNG